VVLFDKGDRVVVSRGEVSYVQVDAVVLTVRHERVVVGVNLLFARKVFSIPRNLRYVLTGCSSFPLVFAFVTHGSAFTWAGLSGT